MTAQTTIVIKPGEDARRQEIRTASGRRAWVQYIDRVGDQDMAYIVNDWTQDGADPSVVQSPAIEHPINVTRWGRNVAANVPRVTRTFAECQGKHRGEPCYIVATGPSLELNWQALSRVQRGVIFGINGVVEMQDIWPLCTYWGVMDGGPIPAKWGQIAAERNGTVTSLLSLRADADMAVNVPNAVWWRPNNDEDSPMPDLPGAMIDTHRTMTAAAINLAYLMGCDPIILVGQDCAFTDMMRHAYEPLTAEDIPLLPRDWGQIFLAPGLGHRVYLTSQLLVVYKHLIEAIATMMTANGRRLVNCSERGILYEGIECRYLADVVASENRRPM